MNADLATFAEPWRRLPRIFIVYVACRAIGATVLTFLQVRYPLKVASQAKPSPILPESAPIENAPDMHTDFPAMSQQIIPSRQNDGLIELLEVMRSAKEAKEEREGKTGAAD